jgi:hypothetical protein
MRPEEAFSATVPSSTAAPALPRDRSSRADLRRVLKALPGNSLPVRAPSIPLAQRQADSPPAERPGARVDVQLSANDLASADHVRVASASVQAASAVQVRVRLNPRVKRLVLSAPMRPEAAAGVSNIPRPRKAR